MKRPILNVVALVTFAARTIFAATSSGEARPRGGLYLVVDLSGGPSAITYPVSRLDAEPQGGWTDEYKTTKLVLRRIPAGDFTMGCEPSELGYTGYESIPHRVTITKPFYIGVFEVTQKQYQLVTGDSPSYFKGDMRPVENVSWSMIRGGSPTCDWPRSVNVDPSTFMGRIRSRTGIASFDLPTEAKWEYACRAGTVTALNTGKDLADVYKDPAMDAAGRYGYDNGYEGGSKDGKGSFPDHHTAVGSYLPNAWGLYDMHGNVWEWTLDWQRPRNAFSPTSETDPVGPVSGPDRVQRGGGWFNLAKHCRSSCRNDHNPSSRSFISSGFRLCCSAEP